MGVIEQLWTTSDDGSVRVIDPAAESPHRRFGGGEVLVALVAFVGLCVAVLVEVCPGARAGRLRVPCVDHRVDPGPPESRPRVGPLA